jgi:hypothetical protein
MQIHQMFPQSFNNYSFYNSSPSQSGLKIRVKKLKQIEDFGVSQIQGKIFLTASDLMRLGAK